jgi:DNA-binding transcriptional LysR family regulator
MPDASPPRSPRPVAQIAGLDLNLLAILRELLRERNVTRAAERVGVTQPAASAALARLRTHFGDELLVRQRGGYVLSPLGLHLVDQVELACTAAERVFSAATSFEPASSDREFTLLMGDYTMAMIGQPLSRLLAEQAPGVRLDIRIVRESLADAGELVDRIDGVIVPPMGPLLVGPVHSVELFRDRWVGVAWEGNPELRGDRPDLARLAEMPWVAPHMPARGDRSSSAPILVQLAMLGIQPQIAVRVASYQAVATFITGTRRIALMQERLARQLAGPMQLRLFELAELSQEIVEALWWRDDVDEDPAHRWLRQAIVQAAAEL